ncbi:MAG TPA: hypothetical protein VK922_14290 [Gemmatimonadaceae bacterium]|nr:hypothetical protein [Gemmatimonadaceae bacterium]
MTIRSDPDDLPTCGKGLAAHAPLPQAFGDLTAAVAEILELHRRALDASDAGAREEDAVYAELAEQHREAAALLRDAAERMRRSRDLPMAPHDLAILADARARTAFATFVRLEEEIVTLLESRLPADRLMLTEMGG